MPTAEIITIGTEILLGEITDTNARHIAVKLREHGVDIYRTTSIGDNIERIAAAIRSALEFADIVITTGGLGPTVDDPTRAAVARAFGVETEFREELWQEVIDRFARFDRVPSENNRRQAYLPIGAQGISNPVGTAPAFLYASGDKIVFSLPGVPREMEHLLEHDIIPELGRRYQLDSVLIVRLLHTTGAGESQIDEIIGDLELLYNPTVGLAAHSGQVDVRITAKAVSEEAARALIAPVEAQVRERLGAWVYGADDDTLAAAAGKRLAERNWTYSLFEAGLKGQLLGEAPAENGLFKGGRLVPAPPDDPGDLQLLTQEARAAFGTDLCLGISVYPGEKTLIYLALASPDGIKFLRVPYGGPPKLAIQRAVNLGFETLRKI
ncbi:MAG TPA: CinA family nicotinamide mononucleotide deamidase-related protein [Anaerolineales bacterium]|nr:CinA family nicotinamide mononucleotide deamidase-related protein [Anaerolineales bacterium]